MHAFVPFPRHLHWTAQQLADAVPLRLHQLLAFNVGDVDATAAANTLHRAPRAASGYLPKVPLPAFRIR